MLHAPGHTHTHNQMLDTDRTLDTLRVQFQCMDVKIHTGFRDFDVRMAGVVEELACVREEARGIREDARGIRESIRDLDKKLDAVLKRMRV
jgi:hypothetical protein